MSASSVALGMLLLAPAAWAQQAAHEVSDEVGRIELLPGDLDRYHGLVVCAPHADYDGHTGQMVGWIHDATDMPAIRAWGYRRPSRQIWFDVNRPCQRLPASGELAESRTNTDLAAHIYETWQQFAYEAGGVEHGPLDLYVDIHGHGSRYTQPDGTRPYLEVIEAVATGFTDEEVERIRTEYLRLAEEHGLTDPPPMHFFQTEPYFQFDGQEIDFYWSASGARMQGALRPECASHALHFENPPGVRNPPDRRRALAAMYADLIPLVWEEMVPHSAAVAGSSTP